MCIVCDITGENLVNVYMHNKIKCLHIFTKGKSIENQDAKLRWFLRKLKNIKK